MSKKPCCLFLGMKTKNHEPCLYHTYTHQTRNPSIQISFVVTCFNLSLLSICPYALCGVGLAESRFNWNPSWEPFLVWVWQFFFGGKKSGGRLLKNNALRFCWEKEDSLGWQLVFLLSKKLHFYEKNSGKGGGNSCSVGKIGFFFEMKDWQERKEAHFFLCWREAPKKIFKPGPLFTQGRVLPEAQWANQCKAGRFRSFGGPNVFFVRLSGSPNDFRTFFPKLTAINTTWWGHLSLGVGLLWCSGERNIIQAMGIHVDGRQSSNGWLSKLQRRSLCKTLCKLKLSPSPQL